MSQKGRRSVQKGPGDKTWYSKNLAILRKKVAACLVVVRPFVGTLLSEPQRTSFLAATGVKLARQSEKREKKRLQMQMHMHMHKHKHTGMSQQQSMHGPQSSQVSLRRQCRPRRGASVNALRALALLVTLVGALLACSHLPLPAAANADADTNAAEGPVLSEAVLREAQRRINAGEAAHCYDRSSSRKHYEQRKYDSLAPELQNTQTLVYPFCLKVKELGNKLGNYFTELTCAHAAGLNFVTVHQQWDLEGAHTNVTDKQGNVLVEATARARRVPTAFLEGLPTVVSHPHPAASAEQGRERVARLCDCNRYCWGDPRAPWVNQTDVVATHLRAAIKGYIESIPEVMAAGTQVSADTDFSNAREGQVLPIVPDVAIQYRCGDNIGFNYMYGLLPFFAFPPRIPANVSTIYVLSDHPTRSQHAVYSGRCQPIQEALFRYLAEKFPQATVVVKRGGDLFLDYARLAGARVTICSASTYCLWPALASRGKAYFPLTSLVGGADNIALAKVMKLPPHFEWIEDPLLISDLRSFRPWSAVVEYLLGNTPRPPNT